MNDAPGASIVFREATGADMPGIARVRFSVDENLATPAQFAERGITNESVAASLLRDSKAGWLSRKARSSAFRSPTERQGRSLPSSFFADARAAGSAAGSSARHLPAVGE
jgi:hypothetical protein